MAAELRSLLEGVEVVLVAGGGGVFDVSKDGQVVYSKRETGRFPGAGDVIDAL